MQIQCCISGELFRCEYFDHFHLNSRSSKRTSQTSKLEHPIFSLQTRDLLVRVKDWSKQNFSETENKLLFLALLKKTNAVIFNAIPRPSEATVQKNMFPLFKLLGSADLIQDGSIPLPRYSISEENSSLQNINHWISSWNEAKEAFFTPRLRWELQARLDKRDRTLWRLLNSPGLDSEKFASRFSKWVMVAADVPGKQFKVWTEIFNCKVDDDKIFSFDPQEVEDFYNHVVVELTNIFSNKNELFYSPAVRAIEHISRIRETVKEGRISRLSNGKVFEIMDHSSPLAYKQEKEDQLNFSEFKSVSKLVQEAPEEKPREEDYKSALAYMRAKAAWTLKNNSLSEGQKSVISRLREAQKQVVQKSTISVRPISELSEKEKDEVLWIA